MNSRSPTPYSYILKSIFYIYKPLLEVFSGWYLKNRTSFFLRNSARLSYARFPMSDLDLTIYIQDKNNFDKKRISHVFNILRLVLPICREANIYLKSQVSIVEPHLNIYEYGRDPMLAEVLKIKIKLSRDQEKYQKFVFALKMFLVDFKNLLYKPYMRKPKWSHHFDVMGIQNFNLDLISYKYILEKIIEILELEKSEAINVYAAIDKMIKFKEEKKPMHDLTREFNTYPLIPIIFFPQYAYGNFISHPLSNWQIGIIEEQINWEIVGCCSQMHINSQALKEHLENLGSGIKNLQDLYKENLFFAGAINSLESILRK